MTGLNSLTNFYCPQISNPVSHEIYLSSHQINYCLFKNGRIDEVKSSQSAPASGLPQLISMDFFFNPDLCLSFTNTKPLSPTPLMDSWAMQQRAIKGLFLKNRGTTRQGGKKLGQTRKLFCLLVGQMKWPAIH